MQVRKQPETLRLRAINPAITATDLQASLAWYRLAQEPTDQPWGTRDFAVVDPDGFSISISTEMKG